MSDIFSQSDVKRSINHETGAKSDIFFSYLGSRRPFLLLPLVHFLTSFYI